MTLENQPLSRREIAPIKDQETAHEEIRDIGKEKIKEDLDNQYKQITLVDSAGNLILKPSQVLEGLLSLAEAYKEAGYREEWKAILHAADTFDSSPTYQTERNHRIKELDEALAVAREMEKRLKKEQVSVLEEEAIEA